MILLMVGIVLLTVGDIIGLLWIYWHDHDKR